ncbi:MAG: acetoacetate decarboxylase family protein, partial [Actinobacteria bacterium]|nr:acetoacetate decarboxylase family protein [Actinomycetota bacterium]
MSASYEIQGRPVAIPVEVRDARQWAAQFLVPADAAQAVIGDTGLQVARPFPGRAMLALAVVDYRDTDLDAYHEVAVSFVVRHHDAPAVAGEGELLREFWSGKVGAYIHQLPVDQTFTLEAGVLIWGFP